MTERICYLLAVRFGLWARSPRLCQRSEIHWKICENGKWQDVQSVTRRATMTATAPARLDRSKRFNHTSSASASPHHPKVVRRGAKAAHIQIAFLPFRAPGLMPCEDLWRHFKAFVAANRVYPDITELVERAVAWLDAISPRRLPLPSGYHFGQVQLAT